jgi:hypothetical protein
VFVSVCVSYVWICYCEVHRCVIDGFFIEFFRWCCCCCWSYCSVRRGLETFQDPSCSPYAPHYSGDWLCSKKVLLKSFFSLYIFFAIFIPQPAVRFIIEEMAGLVFLNCLHSMLDDSRSLFPGVYVCECLFSPIYNEPKENLS